MESARAKLQIEMNIINMIRSIRFTNKALKRLLEPELHSQLKKNCQAKEVKQDEIIEIPFTAAIQAKMKRYTVKQNKESISQI